MILELQESFKLFNLLELLKIQKVIFLQNLNVNLKVKLKYNFFNQ